MKKIFSYWPLAVLIYIGCKAVKEVQGGHESGFMSVDNVYFFFLILISLAVTLIYLPRYITTKVRREIIPLFVALIFLSLVIYYKYENHLTNTSKSLFQVSNLPASKYTWLLNFKENKHFIFTKYDILEQTVYYGEYKIVRDTVKIIKTNYNDFFPHFGILKNDTMYWNKFEKMVLDHTAN